MSSGLRAALEADLAARAFAAPPGASLTPRRVGAEVELIPLEVATGRREAWKLIRLPDSAGVQQIGDVLLTPDAASYVYNYHRRLTDLYLAEGLR